MNFDTFILFAAKSVSLLLVGLHFLFALLLIRQTKMMLRVIEAKISPIIYALSLIHALFSLFIFLWSFVFL